MYDKITDQKSPTLGRKGLRLEERSVGVMLRRRSQGPPLELQGNKFVKRINRRTTSRLRMSGLLCYLRRKFR